MSVKYCSRRLCNVRSHKRSGLRLPCFVSSTIVLATISLTSSRRSAIPSAARVISNATPMTRVVLRSNLTPFRNEVIGTACSLHVSGGKRSVGERSDAEPLRAGTFSERHFGKPLRVLHTAIDVAKDYQCQLSAQIVPVDQLRNGRAKPVERGGHGRRGVGRVDAFGLDEVQHRT